MLPASNFTPCLGHSSPPRPSESPFSLVSLQPPAWPVSLTHFPAIGLDAPIVLAVTPPLTPLFPLAWPLPAAWPAALACSSSLGLAAPMTSPLATPATLVTFGLVLPPSLPPAEDDLGACPLQARCPRSHVLQHLPPARLECRPERPPPPECRPDKQSCPPTRPPDPRTLLLLQPPA